MDGSSAPRSNPEQRAAAWAIVLAAGEGSRLRTLTTTASGVAVPKQFCSLRGGPSLLTETLQRAAAVAPGSNICTVVARQHAMWWRQALKSLPRGNVVVQPENRGTAIGILLPLLGILDRDPDARVVVLPSDHHVVDEPVLRGALTRAMGLLEELRSGVLLLGIAPDEADPGLGYIVPARPSIDLSPVSQFVEKPPVHEARRLIERGALWNAFVVVARGRALAELLARRNPWVLERLQAARRRGAAAIATLYRGLAPIDFSHHVAVGSESALTVLRVPPCGWTDLGTVERLQSTLGRAGECAPAPSRFRARGRLSLQRQHAEWQSRLRGLAAYAEPERAMAP